jgi:hypothetical protein
MIIIALVGYYLDNMTMPVHDQLSNVWILKIKIKTFLISIIDFILEIGYISVLR